VGGSSGLAIVGMRAMIADQMEESRTTEGPYGFNVMFRRVAL
jgi:hypothetical protein